jgi:hypothetical protein
MAIKKKTSQKKKPELETTKTCELLSELAENPDTEPISEGLKAQIIQIVRSEVKSMLGGQTFPKLRTELPPLPKEKIDGEKGRKVAPGRRTKIASTLDSELERLFQEWREERRLTLSRGLDVVFWHFFGKPPLSFEKAK